MRLIRSGAARSEGGRLESVGEASNRVATRCGSVAEAQPRLQVLRPRLPSADRLLSYLQRIDASRIYSNHGPLLREFESRLVDHFALPLGGVVCANSGTTAIVGSILATAGRATEEKPLAIIPAFTFVATAVAVQQCGYSPYLADVAASDWTLDPMSLARHHLLHKVGVVVPVAPFGRPVPQAPWLEFQRATGIPVVIDGAASFDTVSRAPHTYLGDIPVSFSFHATKCFGVGEGGAVATTKIGLARRTERVLNFGFWAGRNSRSPSTNGKMSEYSAAVGLAEFDGWSSKYGDLSNVMQIYQRSMEEVQLSRFISTYPDISTTYALLLCRTAQEAVAVEAALDQHNVDCRRWYRLGIQEQSYFASLPRDDLEITSDILPRLIGLPVAPDLTESDVQRVVAAVKPVLSN